MPMRRRTRRQAAMRSCTSVWSATATMEPPTWASGSCRMTASTASRRAGTHRSRAPTPTATSLVVSEFTNGGVVSTIVVYRWNDPDGDGIDPELRRHLRDQRRRLHDSRARRSTMTRVRPSTSVTITTPWLTVNKTSVGHSLRSRGSSSRAGSTSRTPASVASASTRSSRPLAPRRRSARTCTTSPAASSAGATRRP